MRLVKPGVEVWAASGHHDLPYDYDRPLELIEAAARTCYKSEDKTWTVCPTCEGRGEVPCPDGYAICKTCLGGRFKTSAEKMVDMLERRGHHAMLEHSWAVMELSGDLFKGIDWVNPFVRGLYCAGCYGVFGNHRALNECPCTKDWQSWEPFILPVSLAEAYPQAFSMTAKIVCDRGVTHEIVRHRPASYAQESTRYCNYSQGKFGGQVTFVILPWINVEPGEYDEYEANADEATNDWLNAIWNTEKIYLSLIQQDWSPQQARSVLPNSLKTEIIITASLSEWRHIFKLRCAEAAHPQMREVMIPLREKARQLYPGVFDG